MSTIRALSLVLVVLFGTTAIVKSEPSLVLDQKLIGVFVGGDVKAVDTSMVDTIRVPKGISFGPLTKKDVHEFKFGSLVFSLRAENLEYKKNKKKKGEFFATPQQDIILVVLKGTVDFASETLNQLQSNYRRSLDSLNSLSLPDITKSKEMELLRSFYVQDSTATVRVIKKFPESLKKDLANSQRMVPATKEVEQKGHPVYADRKPVMTALETARGIMGAGNTFDLDKAAECFNIEIDSETRQILSLVPFSEETLRKCASTHFLVADLGLSIEEMQESSGSLFYKANWFQSESFVTKKSTLSWHLIRKNVVPESEKKNWQEQSSLLSGGENVPEARTVVYTSILTCRLTGRKPFDRIYVRTSSMTTSGNRRVIVGQFDGSGLNLLAEEDYETFVTRSYSDPFFSIGLISAMR